MRIARFSLLSLLIISSSSSSPPARAAAAPPAAPTSAPALAAISPPPVLTLAEALSRAERASALVRRAGAERQAVAARDVGAALLFPANPVLGAAAGPRRELGPDGTTVRGLEVTAHIEQTLEIAGQRGTRRAEVERQVETAQWREAVARAETRARVRAVYLGGQLAEAQMRAAERRAALVQQLVDGVQARVAAGAASHVDLALARVERGRAAQERTAAALALATALAELRVLIDVAPAAALALDGPIAAPPDRPQALPALLQRAAAARAELGTLAAGRSAIDAEIVRLRREAIPSPTLFLDVERDLPGQLFVGAGVALPIPLWRRHQGELALARADGRALDLESALTARQIAAEVEEAHGAVATRAEMVRIYESDVLRAAETAVDLTTQGWRAGKFDLFRVIAASREAAEARRSYLETLGGLWEATIALDRAVGAP